MPRTRLTLPLDPILTSLKPSRTLKKFARQLGAKVKNPVGYDPQSRRFVSGEDYARDRAAIDEAHLKWLLELGQRDSDSLTPIDEVMFSSFVGPYTATELKASPGVLRKLATDVCRLANERSGWKFSVNNTQRLVEWSGPYAFTSFETTDWQTAFGLRAADLLAEYAAQVHKCERVECRRLFVAVRRQTYCSPHCSQRARFMKYWNSLSAKERREKRHLHYVEQIRKERGSSAANRVRKRTPKGE
jgi:hypothetical protein